MTTVEDREVEMEKEGIVDIEMRDIVSDVLWQRNVVAPYSMGHHAAQILLQITIKSGGMNVRN